MIKSESYSDLNHLVEILNAHKDVSMMVEGHTDNSGAAAYNLSLSQKRADAVKKYLVNKSVAADRLSAKGYGEEKPVADNSTSSGRAKNRRVELNFE